MSKYEKIEYRRSGVGAWIVFNETHRRNPMSPAWAAEVLDALARAIADPEIRAIALIGSGPAFSAGGDLKAAQAAMTGTPNEFLASFTQKLVDVCAAIRACPKPVVAAVNGLCLAGGLELLLCCDLTVAAQSAVIGDQHANFGLLPAIGGAKGLVAAVGSFKAKEMMLTGRKYSAIEMHSAGLINVVVPDDELEATTQELLNSFANKSPAGMRIMKQMLNESPDLTWEFAVKHDFALNASILAGGDISEGLDAFNQKRDPAFRS